MKLEHVMARAMIRLRTERGWTQADLAIRMQAAGCPWTINRVTQLETLRRRVSLFEAVTLSWVFDVPIADLFAGNEDVETPDGGSAPLSDIRAAMSGQNVRPQIDALVLRPESVVNEETRKIASRLRVTPRELEQAARARFGRSFVEERDGRLGDTNGLPKRSVQTKRGHISRTLITEIAAEMSPPPETIET